METANTTALRNGIYTHLPQKRNGKVNLAMFLAPLRYRAPFVKARPSRIYAKNRIGMGLDLH